MRQLTPTPRTTLRRKKERGRHDVETIHAILDEGMVCHLAVVVEGQPWVIPTAYARVDDALYVHGALANHALRALAGGAPACAVVTLVDGLVLARSAFHHSLNYRSVVLFGTGERVDDPDEKARAMDALVEHLVPGRTAHARPPTPDELRSTLIVRLPVHEASVKVRTGDPADEADDVALPVWAGVLPLGVHAGQPVAAADLDEHVPVPGYLAAYAR